MALHLAPQKLVQPWVPHSLLASSSVLRRGSARLRVHNTSLQHSEAANLAAVKRATSAALDDRECGGRNAIEIAVRIED